MPTARKPKKPLSSPSRSFSHRNSTVSQWGNSLGLRIPREAAQQLKLRAGERVRVEVKSGSMTVTPMRKKWSEEQLLRGVTPEIVEGEIDWGPPAGKEIW